MSSEIPDLAEQMRALRESVDELAEEVRSLKNQVGERAGGSANFIERERADRVLNPDPFNLSAVIPPSPQQTPATIIGGEETNEFPDCCAVGNPVGYYCSGTLIAPNLVVTAEHCTRATLVFLKGSDVKVPTGGETIVIAEQYEHPEVDLRVLVLARDSMVQPRHVAQGAEIGNPKQATLVGFGHVNLSGTIGYGKKRTVEVPIKSLDCGSQEEAKEFGCAQGVSMIAGHRGLLMDSCDGDSGGPLYIKAQNGSFYLLGVISKAIMNPDHKCGDGSICIRVDKFLDWIREQTGVYIPGPLP